MSLPPNYYPKALRVILSGGGTTEIIQSVSDAFSFDTFRPFLAPLLIGHGGSVARLIDEAEVMTNVDKTPLL